MRIAMVGPFGLRPKSTMLSRALNLARPLVEHGHQVCLVMPPWHTPNEADKSWQEDGVQIRYTPLSGGMPGIAWRLLREVLAWQPEVVHCFKPKAYSGLTAWWLWQFYRRRLRLVMDTDDWEGWGGWNELAPYSSWQKRFFAWQERWGIRNCHLLTVASRTLESIVWSHGVSPQRVVYLPNGPGIGADNSGAMNRRRQLGLGERPTLLIYSRLFEFNITRLVEVLIGIKAVIPDLVILFVGAGLYEEDAAQLRQQLTVTGLAASVVDAGWVEISDLPATLAAADLGLYLMEDTLLNRAKCPVKLADMLYAGVPVVAEAVGQVSEYVVHGRTGLLRPVGDVPGLTADAIRLLQDRTEMNRLAAGARAHIEACFSWERLAEVLEIAYKG